MKGFNIFLCVLIFLLAAVSAVFSFFLFEKRAQMVDGWADMASRISATAAALDAGSGTEYGRDLTPSNLAHTNYANIPSLLPKLPEQATNVITERDVLGKALQQIGTTLEMSGLAPEQFQKISSYANATQSVVTYVQNYKKQQDDILNKLSATARDLGAQISASQLKSRDYVSVYNRFEQRVEFWKKQNNDYATALKNIANAIGDRTPNLTDSAYVASTAAVVQSVTTLKARETRLTNELAQAQREIKTLQQTVTEKDGQIADLESRVEKQSKEIMRLCRVLGLETPKEPIAEGSAEALELVRGDILDIDEKFGFVVVSIGKNTRVEETFGNRINQIDPKVPVDATMTVARDFNSGEANYIGRIKLVKVDDNCAIGEIVDNTDTRPRVGDAVYFAPEDIAAIMATR